MIKLPKQVNGILQTLENKGFDAYAVGGCVRDALLGKKSLDWDLATNARLEQLVLLFPNADIINEKLGVLRFTYVAEENEIPMVVDLATFRTEKDYTDHRRPDTIEFMADIEADLQRRDFTINAMADNPNRSLIDLYGGQEDIKKRLIRSVGDPLVRFEEDPLRMLRAVRFAAELDFDLHKSVFDAILQKGHLLSKISIDRIRWEFEKIMVAEQAGKGLKMLDGTNLMIYIVGETCAKKMNTREIENFMTLTENIDKTKPVLARRLGLLYLCFEKKRGLAAVEMFNYDNATKQHLIDGIQLSESIYFLSNKIEFKEFIGHIGLERYEYIHNLTKAQRIVYDLSDIKIQNRNYMMDDIKKNKEAIFVEDLAIDGNDIIEEGIAEGEKVGALLLMLTDIVHRNPKENTREDLLKYAKKFAKSKTKATFRKVKWLK